MPYIDTHLGRGHVPVRVEYDITEDTPDTLTIAIEAVVMFCRPAESDALCKIDLSGTVTDEVLASFEADCRAHEINERKRLADGDGSERESDVNAAKKHTLSHYMAQLAQIGGV